MQIEEILKQTQQMQFGLSPNNINLSATGTTTLPLGKYCAFQVLSETATFTSIYENNANKFTSDWDFELTQGTMCVGDFGSLDASKQTVVATGVIRFYGYNSEKV